MNLETFEAMWNEFASKATTTAVACSSEEVLENGASQEVLSFLEEVGNTKNLSELISAAQF